MLHHLASATNLGQCAILKHYQIKKLATNIPAFRKEIVPGISLKVSELVLYVLVNSFQQVEIFPGLNQTWQRKKCHAQGHITVPLVDLSKLTTTEPLHSALVFAPMV